MPQKPTMLSAILEMVTEAKTPSQVFRQWAAKVSKSVPIVGTGTPEGVIEAPQYSEYTDETTPATPVIYRKMLPEIGGDRSKGWISAIALDSLTLNGSGAIQLEGDATVWEDIQNSLIGRRLNSTAGTVDYNYADNTIEFSGGGSITDTNDTTVWNIQLRHAAALNTLRLHVHFEQSDATNRTLTARYRIQNNGEAKETSWTTVTADTDDAVWTWASGTINNILPIDQIDISGAALSSVVQFQMTRTDSNGGILPITFADCHIELESLGSDNEFS